MNNQLNYDFMSFKKEAIIISNKELFLSNLLEETIISCKSFSECISRLLSISFSGLIPATSWLSILLPIFNGEFGKYEDEELSHLLIKDLKVVQERDPACDNLVHAFINFKGFKALQSHRAAHVLWNNNRKDIALTIQARCSELWSVDIHPAARLGEGLLIDHGTGVVIGETALVGKNCSFLHGVTLGSTGKESGDRHPKIGDNVLIGCNSIVLGNIVVGSSCKIGSGSVVIKSIPNGATVVGNPARIIGQSNEKTTPSQEMDLALTFVRSPCGAMFNSTWMTWADGSVAFEDLDIDKKGYINKNDFSNLFKVKFGNHPSEKCISSIFPLFDVNNDGKICEHDFNISSSKLQPLLKIQNRTDKFINTLSNEYKTDSNSKEMDNMNHNVKETDVDSIVYNYFEKLSTNSFDGSHI